MTKHNSTIALSTQNKMDFRKRMQQFNKRWSIPIDTTQDFGRFRNRILAAIDYAIGQYLLGHGEIARRFAFLLGQDQQPKSTTEPYIAALESITGRSLQDDGIYKAIANAPDLPSLIRYLQALFWALEESSCPQLDEFAQAVQEAIKYSSSINLRLVRRNKQVMLYPAGAALLDEKVVNETLSWLTDYPNVVKHFEEALQIFSLGDDKKYRNLLDNLRFSLEQVVRIVLSNKKSLENQEASLLRWLSERGVHQQIINVYRDLLARFIQYQNDAVKHGEMWTSSEIEFMIYLTGLMIRLLLQLNEQSAG